MRLDTDQETLLRWRETILKDEDFNLFLRIARGQQLNKDLIEIDKVLEKNVTKADN